MSFKEFLQESTKVTEEIDEHDGSLKANSADVALAKKLATALESNIHYKTNTFGMSGSRGTNRFYFAKSALTRNFPAVMMEIKFDLPTAADVTSTSVFCYVIDGKVHLPIIQGTLLSPGVSVATVDEYVKIVKGQMTASSRTPDEEEV